MHRIQKIIKLVIDVRNVHALRSCEQGNSCVSVYDTHLWLAIVMFILLNPADIHDRKNPGIIWHHFSLSTRRHVRQSQIYADNLYIISTDTVQHSSVSPAYSETQTWRHQHLAITCNLTISCTKFYGIFCKVQVDLFETVTKQFFVNNYLQISTSPYWDLNPEPQPDNKPLFTYYICTL